MAALDTGSQLYGDRSRDILALAFPQLNPYASRCATESRVLVPSCTYAFVAAHYRLTASSPVPLPPHARAALAVPSTSPSRHGSAAVCARRSGLRRRPLFVLVASSMLTRANLNQHMCFSACSPYTTNEEHAHGAAPGARPMSRTRSAGTGDGSRAASARNSPGLKWTRSLDACQSPSCVTSTRTRTWRTWNSVASGDDSDASNASGTSPPAISVSDASDSDTSDDDLQPRRVLMLQQVHAVAQHASTTATLFTDFISDNVRPQTHRDKLHPVVYSQRTDTLSFTTGAATVPTVKQGRSSLPS